MFPGKKASEEPTYEEFQEATDKVESAVKGIWEELNWAENQEERR